GEDGGPRGAQTGRGGGAGRGGGSLGGKAPTGRFRLLPPGRASPPAGRPLLLLFALPLTQQLTEVAAGPDGVQVLIPPDVLRDRSIVLLKRPAEQGDGTGRVPFRQLGVAGHGHRGDGVNGGRVRDARPPGVAARA